MGITEFENPYWHLACEVGLHLLYAQHNRNARSAGRFGEYERPSDPWTSAVIRNSMDISWIAVNVENGFPHTIRSLSVHQLFHAGVPRGLDDSRSHTIRGLQTAAARARIREPVEPDIMMHAHVTTHMKRRILTRGDDGYEIREKRPGRVIEP